MAQESSDVNSTGILVTGKELEWFWINGEKQMDEDHRRGQDGICPMGKCTLEKNNYYLSDDPLI